MLGKYRKFATFQIEEPNDVVAIDAEEIKQVFYDRRTEEGTGIVFATNISLKLKDGCVIETAESLPVAGLIAKLNPTNPMQEFTNFDCAGKPHAFDFWQEFFDNHARIAYKCKACTYVLPIN
jgi:hypothetical protein